MASLLDLPTCPKSVKSTSVIAVGGSLDELIPALPDDKVTFVLTAWVVGLASGGLDRAAGSVVWGRALELARVVRGGDGGRDRVSSPALLLLVLVVAIPSAMTHHPPTHPHPTRPPARQVVFGVIKTSRNPEAKSAFDRKAVCFFVYKGPRCVGGVRYSYITPQL